MKKYLDLEGLTHLHKKMQAGLAGKQDCLAGLPGELLGFGADGRPISRRPCMADIAGGSGCNLLDNAYWARRDAIVNQRAKNEYAVKGYTIDRFQANSANVAVKLNDKSMTIENRGGDVYLFQEKVEGLDGIMGQEATLSVLTEGGSLCTSSGVIPHITGEAPLLQAVSTDERKYQAELYAGGEDLAANIFSFRFLMMPHQSESFQAVKLELGPVQTLARQNAAGRWELSDPPPNQALELAKCQRYYRIIENVNAAVGAEVQNERYLTSSVSFGSMRVAPAVSLGKEGEHVGVVHGVQYLKPTELGIVSVTKSGVTLYLPTTAAAGANVAGKAASIYKIMLDANL